MDLVDIVLRRPSHEIIGRIAVQHKQYNFVRQGIYQGTKVAALLLPLLGVLPALAGSIVHPSKPDPLLDSGPTDPCAAGADYATGVDANGKQVVAADVAGGRVPLPDTVAIPLGNNRPQAGGRNFGRGGFGPGRGRPPSFPPGTDNASNRDSTWVALDGRKLEPLLNPAPCAPVR
jgi:hypothetical protein